MDNHRLWIVSIKSKRLDGCSLDYDGSEFYFVEYLTLVEGSEQARASVEHALQEEKLALTEILKCEVYNPDLWSEVEHFSEIEKAAEKTKETQKATFALFISSLAMEYDENLENDNDDIEWD